MRKVVFGGANSLDNYFARKDHSTDWLRWSDEVAAVTAGYWESFDTVLMGRKTYQVALRHSNGKAPYPDKATFVFSRTLTDDCGGAVTIVSTDATEFVRQLKGQRGKDICLMGGGELARSFFEAGLVDEVGFNVQPVLLGSGIPLFHEMTRQIDLTLLECRPFENGCVLLKYRVNATRQT
jgi:dihydrofolate reductase